jgi:hypothetical protein
MTTWNNAVNASQTGVQTINNGVWIGSTFSQYSLLVGSTSNTLIGVTPSPTTGIPVISNGSSAHPVFGTAVVAGGGTGATSFIANAPICGGTTPTGTLQSAATGLGTSGFVLTSIGTGAVPSFQAASITINGNTGSASGSAITITTGASRVNGTAAFTGSGTTITQTFDGPNGNLGIGTNCLIAVSSGILNTGVGSRCLEHNTTASANTAVGYAALFNTTESGFNIAMGQNALSALTTGDGDNTGVGHGALRLLNTGYLNVAIGHQAGSAYTGAEYGNICIGYNVYGSVGDTQTIRIGIPITTPLPEIPTTKCVIGGICYGSHLPSYQVFINGDGELGTNPSSVRFKENIQDIGSDADRVPDLRPVTFNYKSDEIKRKQFGLIAEEVEKLFPHLVPYDNEGKPYTVRYDMLSVLLLNEMQKMAKKIADLESRVNEFIAIDHY